MRIKLVNDKLNLSCALAFMTGLGIMLNAGGAQSWDFQYDILPVLVKSGCSSAECHGGATGRGGFKLSLFGTDPLDDYDAIVRHSFGKRVDLHSPDESLILLKPTRRIPHEGGRIFNEGSPEFQTLYEWIRDGAPYLDGDKHQLQKVSLSIDNHNPDRLKLSGHFHSQDVGGSAHIEKDLTHLALFRSTDESVIHVDHSGIFRKVNPGEVYITAQFLNYSDSLHLIFPFDNSYDSSIRAAEIIHPLDKIWHNHLNDLKLDIPNSVPRWRFHRRLLMTVAGRPPAKFEMDSHLSSPDELNSFIDNAMDGPGFQRKWSRWARQWLELEPASQSDPRRDQMARLSMQVEAVIQNDGSLKELAEIILGKNQDTGFLRRFSDPRDRSEYVARSLLGIRIGCARCHNHPDDIWSRVDHLKFSAAFSNHALESANPDKLKNLKYSRDWESAIYRDTDTEMASTGMSAPVSMTVGSGADGDRLFLPGTKYAVEPAFLPLGGREPTQNRRDSDITLSEWFSSSANGSFARNLANRIFRELTGVALVSPVDDHRKTNPARYEPMLDHLADKFEEFNFKLKPFIRYIASSQMFRMEGMDDADSHTLAESRYLTRWVPLALDNDAWTDALGGMLGIQIQPLERSDNPLSLQLALLNSDWLTNVLATPGNQFEAMNIFFTGSDSQRLQELHQLALTRSLTENEVAILLNQLSQSDGSVSPDSWEHFLKAMVMSPEFCFIR